jgi:hypothetical protein
MTSGAEDRRQRLDRRQFLAGSLAAAAAGAAAGCASRGHGTESQTGDFFPVLSPSDYDYDGMMAVLDDPAPHKQVFSAAAVIVQNGAGFPAIFAHMQFAMNAYDFSLRGTPRRLATLGVLSGSTIVLALNDDAWRTYEVGSRFGLPASNAYYYATSNLDPAASPNDPHGLYQDWSAQAILRRGGKFMVCHNALAKFASGCAARTGSDPAAVLADLVRSLLPGFMLVPAGVLAVQLAQERGWKLYTVA